MQTDTIDPYYYYQNSHQSLLTRTSFAIKYAKTKHYTLTLPDPNITYAVITLHAHQLRSVSIPQSLKSWQSFGQLNEVYIEVGSKLGCCDPCECYAQLLIRSQQLLLIVPSSNFDDDTAYIRLNDKAILGYPTIAKWSTTVFRDSINESYVKPTQTALSLVHGNPLIEAWSSFLVSKKQVKQFVYYPDTLKFTKKFTTLDGVCTIEGVRYIIFNGDYVDNTINWVRPISRCVFYISVGTKSQMIPITGIKQLSPWDFLIEYDLVFDVLNRLGSGPFEITGVHSRLINFGLSNLQLISDTAFMLSTFNRLSPEERFNQYLGLGSPQYGVWEASALMNNTLVKQLGVHEGRYDDTNHIPQVNPFYDYTYNRFRCTWHDNYESLEHPHITGNITAYPNAIGFVYSYGIKKRQSTITIQQNNRFIPDKLSQTSDPGLEVFPNGALNDTVVVSTGGTVVSILPNQLYKVYELSREDINYDVSLCKDIPYKRKYVERNIQELGTYDEETQLFTFHEEIIGRFVFMVDHGVEVVEYSLDEYYLNHSVIMFSSVSETIPRFDCDAILFLNGRELCPGIDYVFHTAEDETGKYGIEFYLTGVNAILPYGNCLEIVYLRGFSVQRAQAICLPKNKGFASHLLPAFTQVTLDGCAINRGEYAMQDGSIFFENKDHGCLMLAREVIPNSVNIQKPDTTMITLRKMASTINLSTSEYVPREKTIEIISIYTQKILSEAYQMYKDGTIYMFNSTDDITAWKAKFDSYKDVDRQIDPILKEFTENIEHSYSKSNIPIEVRNFLDGVPSIRS